MKTKWITIPLLLFTLCSCAPRGAGPVLSGIFPYKNANQLRSEMRGVAYQGMTGTFSAESFGQTVAQRYRSRGADLGPMLMRYYRGKGVDPNTALFMDVAQDAWQVFITPAIFDLR